MVNKAFSKYPDTEHYCGEACKFFGFPMLNHLSGGDVSGILTHINHKIDIETLEKDPGLIQILTNIGIGIENGVITSEHAPELELIMPRINNNPVSRADDVVTEKLVQVEQQITTVNNPPQEDNENNEEVKEEVQESSTMRQQTH